VAQEALVLVFSSARIFLAQEFAQLLPTATNTNHDMPSKNPYEYDELITYFVFAVSNTNHWELCRTSALT
jgi:hypothetical protein